MIKLFNKSLRKKKKLAEETAPQLSYAQRQALKLGGLPSGARTYDIYDRMQQDAMVQTAITLKKLGTIALPFRIDPADESDAAMARAAFVRRAFDDMNGSPRTILRQAMDAFAKGWSVQELVYEARDGRIWLKEVKAKDPSGFGLDVDPFGSVKSLQLFVPGEGARQLPRSKFVVYAHRQAYGEPGGKSDLDAAYTHWQSKQTLLAAWKLHLERFASPTVLGKFARGLPAADQAAILASLRNLSQNTAIVFPEEISIDTLPSRGEGTGAFLEAIDYHNREIARSILGQTLTTDEGRRVGSLALGKVHLQVLLLQLESLRQELADVVMNEQVIKPLIELNFGRGLAPKFVFEASPGTGFVSGNIE